MDKNTWNHIVVIHLKKRAQNRLVCDVIGVLTIFGSSNIILAIPSNSTETIVLAGDPAVKIHPACKITQFTSQKKKNLNATVNEFLKWYWPMRNDVTSLPVTANYQGKHTTSLSLIYILYEYTHSHWARFGSR